MIRDSYKIYKDDLTIYHGFEIPKLTVPIINLKTVEGIKRIYDETITEDRLKKWLAEEDPIEIAKQKYYEKFKREKALLHKKIEKLKRRCTYKRRCS